MQAIGLYFNLTSASQQLDLYVSRFVKLLTIKQEPIRNKVLKANGLYDSDIMDVSVRR